MPLVFLLDGHVYWRDRFRPMRFFVLKRAYLITDMHCPSCVIRVESIEDELAGILKASASYHKQELIVEFDEKVITEEEILTALENLGYHVSLR